MRSRPARPVFLLCTLAGVLFIAAGALASTDPPAQAEQPAEPVEPPGQPPIPPGPGEPAPPTPEELTAPRPIRFQFQARGELGMNADLRDEPGDVTISRLGATFGAAIPVLQYAQLDVALDYEFSHYAFSDADTISPGFDGPWERVHRESLSLRFSQQLSTRAAVFAGGSFGYSHEEGARLGDSIVVSAFTGARYSIADRLTISLGFALQTQLEDSPLLIPLPGVDWRVNDRVRLTTGGRLGATLEYIASEELKFSLGGAYQLREFRLRDNGPMPGGVGRDSRIPIAAGITYTPTPQLSIELSGGAYLGQKFRLSDDAGTTRAEFDGKPTPYAGLQVGYRF